MARAQLAAQQLALGRRAVDEEIANAVSHQPDITPECGEGLVLFDEMAVDLEMLSRYADLNAVGFDGGEHQNGDDCSVSGVQARALTPLQCHPDIIVSHAPNRMRYGISRILGLAAGV